MTWFVVDGMDGSGKSTVGHLIEEKMIAQGRKVLFLEHHNDSCRSGRLAHKYLLKHGEIAMILSTTFYIFKCTTILVEFWFFFPIFFETFFTFFWFRCFIIR